MIKKHIIISLFILLLSFPIVLNRQTVYAEKEPSEIVMEQNSLRVLYEKNAKERRPIASLTKIMTAITVLENADLERDFTIPKSCVGIEGSSVYLKEGDVYSIKDLLYGLMLRSGNDCAVALSVATCGSEELFVRFMNDKVASLGLSDTHFDNPHGLDSKTHYSTAYDLAVITSYAMKNQLFREISSCKKYVATEKNLGVKHEFNNKNKLLFSYDNCTGGKTGFTKRSGRCLASCAEKEGLKLTSIVLGLYQTYEATVSNFEECFSSFKYEKVCEPKEFEYSVNFKNASDVCNGYIKESFYYPLKKDNSEKVDYRVKLEENIHLPLKKDEKIGILQILVENQLIFSQNIYTILDVEKKFDINEPINQWGVLEGCNEN